MGADADVGVANLLAISIKDANADAPARSIRLLAPKIIGRKQVLLVRKIVQERHRYNLSVTGNIK